MDLDRATKELALTCQGYKRAMQAYAFDPSEETKSLCDMQRDLLTVMFDHDYAHIIRHIFIEVFPDHEQDEIEDEVYLLLDSFAEKSLARRKTVEELAIQCNENSSILMAADLKVSDRERKRQTNMWVAASNELFWRDHDERTE